MAGNCGQWGLIAHAIRDDRIRPVTGPVGNRTAGGARRLLLVLTRGGQRLVEVLVLPRRHGIAGSVDRKSCRAVGACLGPCWTRTGRTVCRAYRIGRSIGPILEYRDPGSHDCRTKPVTAAGAAPGAASGGMGSG